ncbi:MAG: hypothetical protein ACHQRJ_10855 [Alphaproteobacteria bacterium]
MDWFSFVGKFVGITARVGAVFALAALILYVGRREGVEFFTGLDPVLIQSVIVAGIIGGCAVVVDLLKTFGRAILWVVVEQWLPDIVERRNAKRVALRNMEALPREYADVLRFLKSRDLKRVPVGDSQLLHLMEKAHLLKRDLHYSISATYVVPDYVWNAIDERLKNHPVPAFAPWIPPPQWIAPTSG